MSVSVSFDKMVKIQLVQVTYFVFIESINFNKGTDNTVIKITD